jgi:hypothetical protein
MLTFYEDKDTKNIVNKGVIFCIPILKLIFQIEKRITVLRFGNLTKCASILKNIFILV